MKLKFILAAAALLTASLPAFAAVEEPIDHRFKPAPANALLGDWQGTGGYVAQIVLDEHGDYQANVLKAFDTEEKPVAILRGKAADGAISLRGGGWSGAIADGHFKGAKGGESFDLQRVARTSPTMGANPPAGAIVLFDGKNLDAWANKKGKEWLVEDGPAPWKITADGALEVVPGTGGGIITRRPFGDCHLHVEFRTLGAPSNSGVFIQTRYEVDINETYGRTEGSTSGGLGNCTPKGTSPRVRAARPPLEWQTFDIDFRAARFDAAGNKTANPRATVVLNGVKIYDQQELNHPTGAAGRLDDAPTGPLMLQEHGMPLQFRNIWLVESAP
jgi:hypothetical protein